MSRLRADLLLFLTAIIWGTAFLFQKTAMEAIGPFTFIGARFALSALVVLPFALREAGGIQRAVLRANRRLVALLCGVFVGGVVLQQLGMVSTTVTNAGFLTGLYAILTPLVAWVLFRQRPKGHVWAAGLLCILGVWLLGDGSFTSFNAGDGLVIGCSVCFALHTGLVGYLLGRFPQPFSIACSQYLACAAFSLLLAAASEPVRLGDLYAAAPSILFAGLLSGGVAYTLQFIAQQHTPPADAAIILSAESLFAALAGVLFMGDSLSLLAWSGCAVILAAILLIEIVPLLGRAVGASKNRGAGGPAGP